LLAFLPQLHQRFPEVLRSVILAKAKMPQSRAVKRFRKQHAGVALDHLEPYAPEYKASERVWQGLKAQV
jgi:hypothetical protein